jgi:hypothetical protein
MAAILFPASPSVGDIYSNNGYSWRWTGTVWESLQVQQQIAFTEGSLSGGNASSTNGTVNVTTIDNVGIPSPYGNNGAYIQSNGNQWVLGSVVIPPSFPSGTAILFQQTAAPTGWTKVTSHNNKALRLVSGTAGTGGTVAFTTAFASGLSADATTLSTTQIPSHTHSYVDTQLAGGGGFVAGGGDYTQQSPGYSTGGAGSGGSHTHTLPSFAVSYVDVIIATKN